MKKSATRPDRRVPTHVACCDRRMLVRTHASAVSARHRRARARRARRPPRPARRSRSSVSPAARRATPASACRRRSSTPGLPLPRQRVTVNLAPVLGAPDGRRVRPRDRLLRARGAGAARRRAARAGRAVRASSGSAGSCGAAPASRSPPSGAACGLIVSRDLARAERRRERGHRARRRDPARRRHCPVAGGRADGAAERRSRCSRPRGCAASGATRRPSPAGGASRRVARAEAADGGRRRRGTAVCGADRPLRCLR